jgi:plasmid stabilization system protein ParE
MPRKRFKIEYLPSAESDLAEIFHYIAGELGAPEAAARLLDEIDKTAEALVSFPYAYHVYFPGFESGIFEFRMVRIKSFLLFYYVIDDTVTIARVVYGARDMPYVFHQNF